MSVGKKIELVRFSKSTAILGARLEFVSSCVCTTSGVDHCMVMYGKRCRVYSGGDGVTWQVSSYGRLYCASVGDVLSSTTELTVIKVCII